MWCQVIIFFRFLCGKDRLWEPFVLWLYKNTDLEIDLFKTYAKIMFFIFMQIAKEVLKSSEVIDSSTPELHTVNGSMKNKNPQDKEKETYFKNQIVFQVIGNCLHVVFIYITYTKPSLNLTYNVHKSKDSIKKTHLLKSPFNVSLLL